MKRYWIVLVVVLCLLVSSVSGVEFARAQAVFQFGSCGAGAYQYFEDWTVGTTSSAGGWGGWVEGSGWEHVHWEGGYEHPTQSHQQVGGLVTPVDGYPKTAFTIYTEGDRVNMLFQAGWNVEGDVVGGRFRLDVIGQHETTTTQYPLVRSYVDERDGQFYQTGILIEGTYTGDCPVEELDVIPDGLPGDYLYPLRTADRDPFGYPAKSIWNNREGGEGEELEWYVFGDEIGLPVVAPIGGEVTSVWSGVGDPSGFVVITYDSGSQMEQVVLMGLIEIYPRVGDVVEQGCLIGKLGQASPALQAGWVPLGPSEAYISVVHQVEFGSVWEDTDLADLRFMSPPDTYPIACSATVECLNDGEWTNSDDDEVANYDLSGHEAIVTENNFVTSFFSVEEEQVLSIYVRYSGGPFLLSLGGHVWESEAMLYEPTQDEIVIAAPAFPVGEYTLEVSANGQQVQTGYIDALCISYGGESSRTCVEPTWTSVDPIPYAGDRFYLSPSQSASTQFDLASGTWVFELGMHSPEGNWIDLEYYNITESASILTDTIEFHAAWALWTDSRTISVEESTVELRLESQVISESDVGVDSRVCYWLESEEVVLPGMEQCFNTVEGCVPPAEVTGLDTFGIIRGWLGWIWCKIEFWLSRIWCWIEQFFPFAEYRIRRFFLFTARDAIAWGLLVHRLDDHEPFGTLIEVGEMFVSLGEYLEEVTISAPVIEDGNLAFLTYLQTHSVNLADPRTFYAPTDEFDDMLTATYDFGDLNIDWMGQGLYSMFWLAAHFGILGIVRLGASVMALFGLARYVKTRWVGPLMASK